jgi:sensor histidine kinase YesM
MLYQKSELEYKNIKKMNNQLRDHQWRIDFLEKDKAIYDAEIELIDVERNIQKEKLKYQRRYIILLIFLIALLFISLIMLVLKNRVQKKHNSYLALKSLRTQMNPHFIFNALNSINNFIVKNDEINANKYLARFSKLMRRILNISELDFIPLEQEIEILELYLQIEHMRFPDKFDYKFEIDEKLNTTDFDIPPMLIQPYIENAVWHGLRYKDKGGILKVEMKLESEILKVRIEDNGIGRAKSKELKTENQLNNKSKGIKNTQARLQILSKIYKSDISQKITDLNEDGSGTVVEIYIPNLNKK